MAVPLVALNAAQITILVDNQTDSLSSVPSFVTQEFDNLARGKMEELSGCCLCCAQHGLSILVDAQAGNQKKTLLFDTGPEAYAFERNIDRLAIDITRTEAVVLSHGHWDHGGGLERAFELIGKKQLPFYANRGMFVKRAVEHPDGIKPLAELASINKLQTLGAHVEQEEKAQGLLENHFYLSGEISRTVPYEKGFEGHVVWEEKTESWKPDPWLFDERYVALNIKGKGLVVFTACSHAGVINVLTDAKKQFPDVPLYAVFGGFHLAGRAMESRIENTVRDLKAFNLSLIAPGHCTGWRAVSKLLNTFGDNVVVPTAIGRSYSLSAR